LILKIIIKRDFKYHSLNIINMTKKIDYISLFARIALALGFLSAVADRLGLWTPLLGSDNVVWGNMESFTAYTGVLLPWVHICYRCSHGRLQSLKSYLAYYY